MESTKTTNVHVSPPPSSRASQAPEWAAPPSQFALSYATAGSFTGMAVSLPVILNGISVPGPICLLCAVAVTVPTSTPPAGASSFTPAGR